MDKKANEKLKICDGKSCGEGKLINTRYVCHHNNLATIRPDLVKQWHEKNIIKPTDVAFKSNKMVWWKCDKDICGCHEWEAKISDKTRSGVNCPFCNGKRVCPHDNFSVNFPQLVKEFHPTKNFDILPESLSSCSQVKVWWICSKNTECNCHEWQAIIAVRTSYNKTNCPYCSGHKLCPHTSLLAKFPEIASEFHKTKNGSINPSEISPGSNIKYWWKCPKGKCECHEYKTEPCHRTNGTGCPYCSHTKICTHSSLKSIFPEISIEWHPTKNNLTPNQISPHSSKKIWWKCKYNKNHEWISTVSNRTNSGNGCPHCHTAKYSKAQIEWVKKIEKEENINIQKATDPEGEFKIEGIGKVDGICHNTKTVYEFNGDFWHGNPSIYDPNETNNVTHTTFGELYNKTIKREENIRKLGYNLVVKWETDFDDTNF